MENEALHTHNFKETIVPPTCKENGYTLYACDCGYEYKTDFQPMGPHNFEMVESTPATCVAPGRGKMVCATCGEIQERTFAPTGHTYGDWVVQAYSTCTEMGRRVRKCERCGVTQEENTPARGHQCVPGTERRVQGRVVDYFCSNCGQTIAGAPAVVEVETKGGSGAGFARVVLIFAALAALLNFVCRVAYQFSMPWVYSNVLLAFSYPALMLITSVIFVFAAGKIKRNTHYTRWTGIVMLLLVAIFGAFLIDDFRIYLQFNYSITISDVLNMLMYYLLPLEVALLLSILFFSGAKRDGGW